MTRLLTESTSALLIVDHAQKGEGEFLKQSSPLAPYYRYSAKGRGGNSMMEYWAKQLKGKMNEKLWFYRCIS